MAHSVNILILHKYMLILTLDHTHTHTNTKTPNSITSCQLAVLILSPLYLTTVIINQMRLSDLMLITI